MNGYEATKIIRQQYPEQDIPIIAMTASALSGAKEECLQAGMNDYISKPINIIELNNLLLKWIKNEVSPLHNIENTDQTAIKKYPPPLPSIQQNDSLSLNINMGLKRFNNNKLYYKSLELFKESQIDAVKRINSALISNKKKQVFRLFNTLKGMSAQIGAERLHEIIKIMEINFSHDIYFLDMMNLLDTELRQVFKHIDQLCFQSKEILSEESASNGIKTDKNILTFDVDSELKLLQKLVSEFDTDSINILDELLMQFSDKSQNHQLLKIKENLEQFDYEYASDLLSKFLLNNKKSEDNAK